MVVVSLSGTQGCQSIQADIDADGCCSLIRWLLGNIDRDADEPPIGSFRHPCATGFPLEAQILGYINPSKCGDPDAMIAQFHLIIGRIKAGFAAFFAFEPRIAGAGAFSLFRAFKKGGKRFSQIQEGLIRGVFGDVPGPGKLFVPDGIIVFL